MFYILLIFKEIILCQTQIIQRLLTYLNLDDWLTFVSAFPHWKYGFPKEILLSENGSPMLYFLLQKQLTQRIRSLRLSSPGPTTPGGAVGGIYKCLLSNPRAFDGLTRLDLSLQMQPIDRLLEVFSVSAFPHLRYLAIRPTEPEGCNRPRSIISSEDMHPPPRLESVRMHLIGLVGEENECYIPALLQLMLNVVHLTVCERMIGETQWYGYLQQVGPFENLETLRIDVKSDLVRAVKEMIFREEKSYFPKLRSLNLSILTRFKRSMTFNNGYCGPLEIAFTGFVQPIEADPNVSATEDAVQLGRHAFMCSRGKLMTELVLSPDNAILPNSPALLYLNHYAHLIETLAVTVKHTQIPIDLYEYISFLDRLKSLCKRFLFPVLKLASNSLKSLELPVELIDPRSVDGQFETMIVYQRGQYPSVKSLSITSQPTFPFCNRSLWHSCHCLDSVPHTQPLKNFCGLFPGLEELIITSDSHLDPDELREVSEICPSLKRLYIHRWPVSIEAYAVAIQHILSACRLEVLYLVVDSLRITGPNSEECLLYPRSWTLKYLYIDCVYHPGIGKEELSRLAKRLPSASWITITNREASKCLEFRRSRNAEKISEIRLDSGKRGKEPRSLFPELYDIFWREEEKLRYFVAEWCHPCDA